MHKSFICLYICAAAHVLAKDEQSDPASESENNIKGDVILEKKGHADETGKHYRPDCNGEQFIELLRVASSNLGSKEDDKEHSLTYNAERCVGYNQGCQGLSVKITQRSHEYEWNDGGVNGLDYHFGVIDIPPWAEADFKIEFLYPVFSLRGSGPMILDKVFITFYDLDVSNAGPEYVVLPNEFTTILSSNSSINKTDAGGDRTKYIATAKSLGHDTDANPKAPLGLSQEQRDRCITVVAENTSFLLFSARSTKHLSFVSPFECSNLAETTTTTTTQIEQEKEEGSRDDETKKGSDEESIDDAAQEETEDDKEVVSTTTATTTPETVHIIRHVNDSTPILNDTLVNITHPNRSQAADIAHNHTDQDIKAEAKDVVVGATVGIMVGAAVLAAVLCLLGLVSCLRKSKVFCYEYAPVTSTEPAENG